MKRLGSLVLAAFLVAAMGITAAAAQKTYKAASGTPTIDGIIDDAYKATETIHINVHTSGTKRTTGTAQILWDADSVYAVFDIKDSAISAAPSAKMHESDSVDWFLDLTGNANEDITLVNAAQYTAPAPIVGQDLTKWSGQGGHWEKNVRFAKYASVKSAKGYIIEMQIPWGADYMPKAGAEILSAFRINADDDGKTVREDEVFANEGQTNAASDSRSYDKLILTDMVYKAPIKHTPPTVDVGIASALAALASAGAALLVMKKKQ